MNRRVLVFVPALAACASGAAPPRTIATASAVPTGGTTALERPTFDAGATSIARGFVVGSVDVRAAIELRADTCTEIGVGLSRGILDADIEAFGTDGTLVARDRAPDRFARIRLCASVPRAVVLRAFAAGGAGELEIVAGPASESDLPRTAILEPSTSDESRFVTRLEDAVESRGFVVDSRVMPIELETSVPARVPLSVALGECVVVAFRADRRARMTLVDGDGGEVASDAGEGRDLVVDGCRGTRADGWSVGLEAAESMRGSMLVARAAEARVGGATGLGGMR